MRRKGGGEDSPSLDRDYYNIRRLVGKISRTLNPVNVYLCKSKLVPVRPYILKHPYKDESISFNCQGYEEGKRLAQLGSPKANKPESNNRDGEQIGMAIKKNLC